MAATDPRRRRTAVRWVLRAVVAAAVIVAGRAVRASFPGDVVAVLVGEAIAFLGLYWFVHPLIARLERFVQRLRRP